MNYMFDDEIVKYCTKCDEPIGDCDCAITKIKHTNPIGNSSYGIGSDEMDYHIFFDYYIREDGKVEIEASVDGGNFTDGLDYMVVDKDEAVDVAQALVDSAIDILLENKVDYNVDEHGGANDFIRNLKEDCK